MELNFTVQLSSNFIFWCAQTEQDLILPFRYLYLEVLCLETQQKNFHFLLNYTMGSWFEEDVGRTEWQKALGQKGL